MLGKVTWWLQRILTAAYNVNFQRQYELFIFEQPGSEVFWTISQFLLTNSRWKIELVFVVGVSNPYFPYYLIFLMNKYSIQSWPMAFFFLFSCFSVLRTCPNSDTIIRACESYHPAGWCKGLIRIVSVNRAELQKALCSIPIYYHQGLVALSWENPTLCCASLLLPWRCLLNIKSVCETCH